MVELQGGEERPRIFDQESLKRWLDTLPPDQQKHKAVIVAARAALRVLPMIERAAPQSQARQFGRLAAAVFWATALARNAGICPTRADAYRAAATVLGVVANTPTTVRSVKAARAATHAATAANADAAPAAAASAAAAAAAAADAHEDAIWRSISADVTALGAGRAPVDLASDPLWPQGAPAWAREHWRLLRDLLAEAHWRPWFDWYQRRLDGVELAEEVELLFATLPVDPQKKAPAEQNALLAQEIARLTEAAAPPKESWDFFISYSTPDDSFARETAAVLEEASYSTFAMFKDIAVGNNFVREMQDGLSRSTQLIALLSPDYEKSDHCRAEWAYAYNRDPSGRERLLIAFLVRETQLNALAQQIVYKSLIGLTQEQRKAAILAAVAPRKPPPAPVENVSAPFSFGWTPSAKLSVVAGPQNTPVFPFANNAADHSFRLDACRKEAGRLAKLLRGGEFNVRSGYSRTLDEYLEDLPTAPGQGNLLTSDFAARTLHGLLVEDADFLAVELKQRLSRVLEAHASLRNYYPSLGQFYADVKSGRLTQPLPIDAVEGFVRTVEEHTPDVFEENVSHELHKVEREPEAPAPSPAAAAEATPTLPPDPLAGVDPKKSHDFSIASSVNALYKAFLNGKDVSQSVKGWNEIAHELGENAGPVIDWLKSFLP